MHLLTRMHVSCTLYYILFCTPFYSLRQIVCRTSEIHCRECNLTMICRAAPSLILRTCLSYLTSNAHTHVRSSHRLSLSLLFYCSLVFVSDRRHLWPKICEESFCKTIFLPSFLPALLLSSSPSSYSSPSELHRRAFRVRSLSSAHGSIALSLKNENAA